MNREVTSGIVGGGNGSSGSERASERKLSGERMGGERQGAESGDAGDGNGRFYIDWLLAGDNRSKDGEKYRPDHGKMKWKWFEARNQQPTAANHSATTTPFRMICSGSTEYIRSDSSGRN